MLRVPRMTARLLSALPALLLLATPAAAQMGGAPKFWKVGETVDMSRQSKVAQLKPPFSPQPKDMSLAQMANGKPLVLLYVDVMAPRAADEIVEFQKLAGTARGYIPAIIAYGRDDKHINQSMGALNELGVKMYVVLDTEPYFALKLGAFRPPHYAAIDGRGTLLVNRIQSLNNPLQDGTLLRDNLVKWDKGSAIARSDGELIRDITSLKGKKIPDFSTSRVSVGKAARSTLSDDDVLKSGKPMLVVFWLATCPHCQKEMPKIWDWYQSHRNELELATFTRLDKPSAVNYAQSYLDKQDLGAMPIYDASQAVFEAFRIQGFPSWAMVSRNGILVEAKVGEDPDLDAHLSAALQRAK